MKRNPLRPTYNALLDRLAAIDQTLHVIDIQLQHAGQLLKRSLEEPRGRAPVVRAEHHFAVHDLRPTKLCEDGVRSSGRQTVAQNDQYLLTLQEVVSKTACWTTSLSYEAFETYLFDAAAAYLHDNQSEADPKRMDRFKENSGRRDVFSLDFWNSFVREIYRGRENKEIRALHRALSPELSQIENWNNLRIDLNRWFRVVTELRHAITHSNFELKSARMQSWSDREWDLFEDFTATARRKTPCTVLMTAAHAQKITRLFGSYGLTIFNLLSRKKQYNVC